MFLPCSIKNAIAQLMRRHAFYQQLLHWNLEKPLLRIGVVIWRLCLKMILPVLALFRVQQADALHEHKCSALAKLE